VWHEDHGLDDFRKPRQRLLPALIPLAVLAAFWPTLHADFITWDDDANFLNNPHFRGLNWRNLRWMFTTLHMSNYQPLSWLTSCLGYSLWSMHPFGYHATSLAFHILNAVLLYLVAARLLHLSAAPDDDAALPVPISIASAFAALFFALHPLRVEPRGLAEYSFPQFRAHLAADPSCRAALLLGYRVHHAPSSRLARQAPPRPAGHELPGRCTEWPA
jgi:hypothetical protein